MGGGLGYVPQKATHIDSPASVEQVVGMALLSNRAAPAAAGRERPGVPPGPRAVGMVSFPGIARRPPLRGQRQHVFIARACVTSPRILFLDEPTTASRRDPNVVL